MGYFITLSLTIIHALLLLPFPTNCKQELPALLSYLEGVDVLIDETYYWGNPNTAADLTTVLTTYGLDATAPNQALYPFIANQKIFREDKSVSDDWGT